MPGLERTRALLAALGNPQMGLRGALVAGTNGKGSVCATVDSVCRAAGHRSVLLTSPHLQSYTERIVRDGAPISETEFGALVETVREAAEALPERPPPARFRGPQGWGDPRGAASRCRRPRVRGWPRWPP